MQYSGVGLRRLDTFFLTIEEIVVNSLMEGICQLINAGSFKVHKAVYAFNLTEKDIVFFAEGYRTHISFICQCVHFDTCFMR